MFVWEPKNVVVVQFKHLQMFKRLLMITFMSIVWDQIILMMSTLLLELQHIIRQDIQFDEHHL